MPKVKGWSIGPASADDGRISAEGPFYELAGELLFPDRIELIGTPQPEGSAPYARLRIEIDFEHGQPICTLLSFERAPGDERSIEASTFTTEVNISQLLNAAFGWVTDSARAIVEITQGIGFRPEDGRYVFTRDDTEERVLALRRRRVITDDFLREVAKVYKADKTGRPTVAVADHFHYPDRPPGVEVQGKRTAIRWVGLARDRGFIDPYDRPKRRDDGID
jgi:hypothetical protein